jgi:serine/threonine-protein kinase
MDPRDRPLATLSPLVSKPTQQSQPGLMVTLSVGQLLDRRYRIVEILSSGAFGQIYLAADLRRPGLPQCIVRQFQFPSRNSKALQVVQLLFKKKAETLEKLGTHDRIPQLLACFEQEGQLFFIEELIQGEPIASELKVGQPQSEDYVVRLLQDTLEVLDFVHKNGVIHRNLRPQTLIRRSADGRIVPIEFGLIQEIANPSARADAIVPPPSPEAAIYMPPEQLQGNPLYNSDLYAIGMICIQALTGLPVDQLPKVKDNNGDRPGHLDWPNHEHLHPGLVSLIERLVVPYFDRRYQSAAEALRDLQEIYGLSGSANSSASGAGISGLRNRLSASNAGTSAAQTAAKEPLVNRWRDRRLWLGVGVVVAALGLGALLLVDPLRSRYWIDRGSEQLKSDNLQAAIANYSQALQADPNNAEALFQRGAAYGEAGDYQKAIADLDRAIRLRPRHAPSYFQRGNARYRLSDARGAIEDYDRALTYDGNLVQAYLNRGNVRGDIGDDRGAIEDYNRVIAHKGTPAHLLAPAYLNRGLSRSNLDDQQGAIDDATKAIQLNPNYALAYQNRGLANRRLGNLQAALKDFNIAIQLDPDDPDPFYNRGLTRWDLGEVEGTIEDLDKAIALNPNHALAYYDRGIARLKQGDQTGALTDLQQSAKLCIDEGRLGCYRDAQYQIQLIQAGKVPPELKLSSDEDPAKPSPTSPAPVSPPPQP